MIENQVKNLGLIEDSSALTEMNQYSLILEPMYSGKNVRYKILTLLGKTPDFIMPVR